MPDKVSLTSDGDSVKSGDSLEADGGEYEIECSADGDVEPTFALFAGAQRIIGAEEDDCNEGDL